MATLRDYQVGDEPAVVALGLRAWEPVFAAIEELLGDELFSRLRGDWRAGQAQAVRNVLANPGQQVWVAEQPDETVIGFVAARLEHATGVGEISMLAVAPSAQRQGLATALTDRATDWLQRSGMRVAMVETGGDPAHAPARRVYQNSGYTALPAVRFFELL
ncbi:GNAT family N-acetyltransferase [Sciscionella marina]|uniref:GNAT family N-acetyltransferase n=1 Tax=Sciscionella marina TaxID=508770 RepID=UPI00036DAE96|nr:GNAT family N-acetyltransferase [Sciscionella marina]